MSPIKFFFEKGSSYLPMEQFLFMQNVFLMALGILISFLFAEIVDGISSYDYSQMFEWVCSGVAKNNVEVERYIAKLNSMVGLDNIPNISSLDLNNLVEVMGWLGPYISTHDSVLMVLSALVRFLELNDSPWFETLNNLCNKMRENGIVLKKFYRAYMDRVAS